MDAVTRLAALLRLTEAVRGAQDMAAVYEAAIDCVEQALDVKRASLLLFDPDGVMRFKAWRGISQDYRTAVEGHSPWTPLTRSPDPLVTPDVAADPELAIYAEVFARENIRGLVFVPLTSQGLVIGKFMLYHAEPVSFSPGQLREAMAVADQIALAVERRARDERLLELNELLRGLVENLPVGVSYVDMNNRLLYANPMLGRIIGVQSTDPYVGQDVRLIRQAISSSFRDPAAYLKLIQEQQELAVPVPSMELVLADGRILERRYFPIHSRGELVGHLAMLEDISQRRQLEAQLLHAQKMDSVGRLAGGIAHDFNNLLMAIGGHVDLALSELPPDSHIEGSLRHALEASKQATVLTRQLLAFARKQPVRLVTLDLHALMHRMKPMLRLLIREDIAMDKRCIGTPAWVRADEGQIEQVIVNLVLNARDAMPSGGTLTLVCEGIPAADASDPGRVVLTVSDSGVGMDAETQARVFEPFYTTKELGRGTGLGLATVYGIVEQAGGRIEVESRLGAGSTFRVELPCVAGPEPAREAVPARAPLPRGHETVLLVEDDLMVRLLAETMLTRLGYQVRAASSGEEALSEAAALQGDLHLLLTDIVMPGMNGRDLAMLLQRERPSLRVLLMSGYAPPTEHGDVSEGFSFLAKPFSAEALASAVRATLALAPDGVAEVRRPGVHTTTA